jgi:hypothetical protein
MARSDTPKGPSRYGVYRRRSVDRVRFRTYTPPSAVASGDATATPAAVAGVGLVPAPTATGAAFALPATVVSVGSASIAGVYNTGEGGNNGDSVSVANSDDNEQGTAWDAVTIDVSSTVTYDNHGNAGPAIKVAKTSTDNNSLEWDATLVNGDTQYGRMFLLYDTLPSANSQNIERRRAASGSTPGARSALRMHLEHSRPCPRWCSHRGRSTVWNGCTSATPPPGLGRSASTWGTRGYA